MRRLTDPVLQEMAKDLMRRADITDQVRTRYLRKLDEVDAQLAATAEMKASENTTASDPELVGAAGGPADVRTRRQRP